MKNLLIFFSIFFFIFSPRIDLYITIHTGYLAGFIVLIGNYKKMGRAISLKSNLNFLFFISFLIIYCFIISLIYRNIAIQFISILISLIFYTIFSFIISSQIHIKSNDYNSFIKLMKYILIGIFINSIIILLEFQYPSFKLLLETILVNDSNANINYLEHPFRLRGLAAAGGAGLSIVNASAIWMCIFLGKRDHINKSLALLIILIINISNIFTGRVGLIYGIIFSIYFIFFIYLRAVNKNKFFLIRDIFILIIFIRLFSDFNLSDEILAWAFEWTNSFQGGKFSTSSTDDLNQMLFIPDNLIHFLFGIGFFEGENKFYPRTDSGYLKTLLSIGFIFSIMFYSILFLKIFKISVIDNKLKLFLYPLIALLLIVEIKEPFLYQNFLARTVFLLMGMQVVISYERKKNHRIRTELIRNHSLSNS